MNQQVLKLCNNLFGADIFKSLADRDGKNVIFSPISIHSCLTMAFLAANGQTSSEMAGVLKFGSAVDKQKLSYEFNRLLTALDRESGLQIANKIYVMAGYALHGQFIALVEQHFKSAVELLDFRKSAEAAKTINTWIEEKTEKRIKNAISADMLDGNDRALLVNTIYFKGKWTNPFFPICIRQSFWVTPTKSVDVDMMTQTEYFRYAVMEGLDGSVLEMAFKGSKIVMLIILPNERDGLEAVEKRIEGINLNEIDQQLNRALVDVKLPKFEYECDLDLKEILIKMGMPTAFDFMKADFSGLLQEYDPNEPPYISNVIHSAFIKVNEVGVEAAGATTFRLRGGGAGPPEPTPEPIKFNVDHPFLFYLTFNSMALFTGKVTKF